MLTSKPGRETEARLVVLIKRVRLHPAMLPNALYEASLPAIKLI
jgi:hypothetical protein